MRTRNCFQTLRGTKGNVLVLLAFIAVPLIIALSLAIDSAVLFNSHTTFQRRANVMALSALEEFQKKLRDSPDYEYSDLVQFSIDRAAEVGSLSGNQLVGEHTTETYGADALFDPNTGQGNNTLGTIEFGRWWHEEPAVTCAAWAAEFGSGGSREGETMNTNCPCPNATWSRPCFEENNTTISRLISETSAVRIRLRTRTSNPIMSIMSHFTETSPALTVTGIASTVPRNGVFLIDLSRSMQVETHLPRERLSGPSVNLASEYSFLLDASRGQSCSLGSANPCPTSSPACKIDDTDPGTPNGGQPEGVYNVIMENSRGANIPGSGSPPIPITKHYKSDYQCVALSYQLGTGGSTINESYLVDTYTNTSNPSYTYRGPEPLNTVLTGIHVALDTLNKRAVAGDRVAVIAFDQDASIPQRIIGPTRPGQQDYKDLTDITDIDNIDSAAIQKRLDAFLFPRANAQTDISGALAAARDLLIGLPNFQIAQNYVVLFSDGMTSCAHASTTGFPHWMTTDNGRRVLSPDVCVAATPTSALRGESGNYPAYNIHAWGLVEATSLISRQPLWGGGGYERFRYPVKGTYEEDEWGEDDTVPTYLDLGIAFHMFMIGDDVFPSTMLTGRADGSGCMTADEQLANPTAGIEDVDPDEPLDDYNYGLERFWGDDWTAFAKWAGSTFWTDAAAQAECDNPSDPAHQKWYGFTLSDPPCEYFYPPNGDGHVVPPYSEFPNWHYVAPISHYYLFGVHPTGGVWAPIRKPCNDASVNPGLSQASCEAGSVLNALDAACSSRDYSSVSQYTTTSQNVWATPRKLLTCDPTCRPKKAQMEDYMKNVFEDNPYIIVE